jgi:hypothetical protein
MQVADIIAEMPKNVKGLPASADGAQAAAG